MNIKTLKDIPPWQWPENAGQMFLDVLLDDQAHESDRLLAAIEAAAFIRPHKASEILSPLLDSDDEDIVDAVYEALAMAGEIHEDEEDDDEGPKTFH
jgi:hypothetical protein